MEMNLGHTHKTRFWYLLRLVSKFSDEHPRHFIGSTPRDLCLWIQSSSTNQLEAPTQNAQVRNDIKKKKQHYREPIPVDSKVANGTTGNVLFDTGLNDLV